jgi:hypothetical protein
MMEKQDVGYYHLHRIDEVEMGVCKCLWLLVQVSDFDCDIIFKHMKRWHRCISVFGDYNEKW